VTKAGIIALIVALGAIALVVIVGPGMSDSTFIIWAYVATAVIIAVYVWAVARRLAQAEEIRAARETEVGP
jgi:cytochrome c-type biogenesis protein CcmH/NrfF